VAFIAVESLLARDRIRSDQAAMIALGVAVAMNLTSVKTEGRTELRCPRGVAIPVLESKTASGCRFLLLFEWRLLD
jgi:hypothetical protein